MSTSFIKTTTLSELLMHEQQRLLAEQLGVPPLPVIELDEELEATG